MVLTIWVADHRFVASIDCLYNTTISSIKCRFILQKNSLQILQFKAGQDGASSRVQYNFVILLPIFRV
jgi:hypothetical protein